MISKVKIYSGFLAVIVSLGLIVSLPLTAHATWKLPENMGTKQLCSTLGGKDKHFHLDIDAYIFEGKKGEKVSITLSSDPSGSHRGEQATLILTSRLKPFFKIDRSPLPNKITAVLPTKGEYFVYVVEQVQRKHNKSFKGGYCITLESNKGGWKTFRAIQHHHGHGQKHTITWVPERVEETLGRGTTKELKVAFISRTDLKKANLWITPELKPFININPHFFDKVEMHTPYEVTLRLTIPSDTKTGLYEGTIHLRVGHRTYPETLKVKLNIIHGVNNPPVANAGPDQVIALPEGQTIMDVQLDGSGSHDPDGTIASYTWTGTPDPEDVVKPVVALAEGIHTFTLVVRDNADAESPRDQVTITVLGPPEIISYPRVTSEETVFIYGKTLPGVNVITRGGAEDATVISSGTGIFRIPVRLNNGLNNLQVFSEKIGIESHPARVDINRTSPALSLKSISPDTGQSGSIVTLTGSGFTPDKNVMGVYFRGSEREQEGFVLEATETTLKVVVPFVFIDTTEDVEVYAYDGTNMSNSLNFHVQPASDPTPDIKGNEAANEFDLLILNVQRTFGKLEQLVKPYVPQEKWAQIEENFNRINTFLQNIKDSLPSDYDPQMLTALDSVFGSDIFFLINQQLDQINEILSHSTTGEAICNVGQVLGILNDIISVLRWVDRALIAGEAICFFFCQWALPAIEVARQIVEGVLDILYIIRDVLNVAPTQATAWNIEVVGPYPGVDPHILFTNTTDTLGLYADFTNGGFNSFVGRISRVGKFVLDLLGIDLGRITIQDVNVPSTARSLNRFLVSNFTTGDDPNTGADIHTLQVFGLPAGLDRQSVSLDVQGSCGKYHYPDKVGREVPYPQYYDVTVIEAPIIDGIQWDYEWNSWYVWGLGFSEMCGDVFRVYWNGQLVDCSCIDNLNWNSFMANCAGMDDPGRIELVLVDPSAPGNRDLWRMGPSQAIGLPPYQELSISEVSPSSGYIGDIVTVIGDHFSPYPEDMTITFSDSEGNPTGVSINPVSITQVPSVPGGPDWLTFKVPEDLRRWQEQTLTFRLSLVNLAIGYGQSWDSKTFMLKKAESAAWGDQDLIAFGKPNGYIRSALIGDITGDGINDLIVGVSQEQSGSGKYMGAVYIAFGPVSGTSLATGQQYIDMNINATDRHWDVVISGDYTACSAQDSNFCERIGNSLAIGDINGDGINDLLIGTTDLSDEGYHVLNPDTDQDTHPEIGIKGHIAGAAYVYYGRPREQWHRSYDIPYGEYDVRIRGDNLRELGYQVAVANLNGDAYGDIVVSAPRQPFNPGQPDLDWSGRVYVIFGSDTLPKNIEVNNIPTSINGAVIAGESEWQREYKGDGLGQGIAVGDINGDGLDDLLVGAPQYYVMYFISGEGSVARKGAVFLFYGQTNFGGDDGYLNATSYTGEQDVLILGPKVTESPYGFSPGWEIGRAMLVADLNHDGKGEVILASPRESLRYGNTSRGDIGLVYILQGNSMPSSGVHGVNQLARAKIYGSTTISRFGASLATGDINNDGYKDLLVGAPGRIGGASGNIGEEDPGQVWGFYGSSNLPAGVIHLIDRSASSGVFPDDFLIKGDQAHSGKRYGFGTFVTAGDLNPFVGDDVLIIDPLARAPEPLSPGTWRDYSGMLYVFYEGKSDLWPVSIYPESVTLNACNDFQVFRVSGGKEPYLFVWDTPNVPPEVELDYQYGDTTALLRINGCVPADFNTLRLRVSDGDPSTHEDVVATINFLHEPDIRVTPNQIEFIDVPYGNTASQTVVVVNDGTADLNISGIAIGGISPQHFSQTNNCPALLHPGASCTITVTFTPPNIYMAWWATLSINSDDPDEPVVNVTLSGYGIPPALSLYPQVLDMGDGMTRASIYVGNERVYCVTPLNWSIINAPPSWLSLSPMSGTINDCGGAAYVDVEVNRSGLPVGEYIHTVSFTSNSGSGSVEVRMNVPPFVSITPSSIDFAEAKKRLPLTIQNTSSDTALTWNITADMPAWLTASQMSGMIPAGGSITVYLYANRSGLNQNQTYSHTLSITSNGGNLTIPVSLSVPVPLATFAKYYGGDGGEYFSKIRPTSDGGFIAVGLTNSFGPPRNASWVVKIDSSGYVEWEKFYYHSGGEHERACDIRETSDGGYIMVIESNTYGLWIFKLDYYGDIEWQKAYGGGIYNFWGDWGEELSIQQTQDNGYIVAGNYNLHSGQRQDFWVLKLDSSGNIQWQKTYGGNYYDYANSIQMTSDGGYIVAGVTRSFTANNNRDMWVLKLDSDGNIQWQKAYGTTSDDYGFDIQQTMDGGFIVVGTTLSTSSAWVLKLNSTGEIEWQKIYGRNDGEYYGSQGYSIRQTSDRGYILTGILMGRVSGTGGIWVVKLDPTGNIEWQKTYGGSRVDVAYSIEQTSEGDYILAGYTNSFRSTQYGPNYDAFVMKIDSIGNIGASCGIVKWTSITPVDTDIRPVVTSITAIDSSATPQETNATVTYSSAVTDAVCSETEEQAQQRPTIDIDVSPLSYDFGYWYPNLPIGQTASQVFTVRNTGYQPLTISNIWLSGSLDFTGSHNCPLVPETLGIARQCEITVSFTPSIEDQQMVYLGIESNDPDEGLIEIPITGSGWTTIEEPGSGEEGSGGVVIIIR